MRETMRETIRDTVREMTYDVRTQHDIVRLFVLDRTPGLHLLLDVLCPHQINKSEKVREK